MHEMWTDRQTQPKRSGGQIDSSGRHSGGKIEDADVGDGCALVDKYIRPVQASQVCY